jgi:dTDP-4-amino-4,6-dideoxygalactose transaminase
MIRLALPNIDQHDIEAVVETLRSGFLVQGRRVASFEQSLADYVGTGYAVAVSSCTAALHASLLALNVGRDDMVIVTAYSWPATANVIALCGAQPVFVDIQPDTFNMEPEELERTLKRLMAVSGTAKKVKAVVPVHTFGQLADMTAVLSVSQRYGIPVLEDAACALGAQRDGRQAGTWGVAGCFSFHPRKAITSGEGGMITTNSYALTKTLRALRNHGLDSESSTPQFIMPGFNYRMTEFQAAFGERQLEKLDDIVKKRRAVALVYDRLLQDAPLRTPCISANSNPNYQSYVVRLDPAYSDARDRIIEKMMERGIETNIGTYDMTRTGYFNARYGFGERCFPRAGEAEALSLALPMHENLSEDDVQHIAMNLKETLLEASG